MPSANTFLHSKSNVINFSLFRFKNIIIPIANVETRQSIEFDVIERDGKEYIKIKNVRPHLKLTGFSVQFKSKTGNPTIENTINKVINENWREIYNELKPDLELNVGDVIKSIITPLFDSVPYQEFFLQ